MAVLYDRLVVLYDRLVDHRVLSNESYGVGHMLTTITTVKAAGLVCAFLALEFPSNERGFICIIARKIRLRIIHYSSALPFFSYIFLSSVFFFIHFSPMVPLGYLTKTLKLMGHYNKITILLLNGKKTKL